MLTQDQREAFDVIPAIDVLEGRVVRLSQGRREAVTIEGGDPVELARRFRDEGARRLHLVDLDGAFSGTPTLDLVERVAAAGGLPLQVGGGYRTIEAIEAAIAAGADRVMVGTAALSPSFLAEAAARFAERSSSSRSTPETARSPSTAGRARRARPRRRWRGTAQVRRWHGSSSRARRVTARSQGPTSNCWRRCSRAGLPVIAAGGISSIEDLLTVRDLGCEAAVAGSALLAGRFTLTEAMTRLYD